ncbi:A/G-specific adenine glycosylase [Xylophilus sp. GW821-FHT01B05]
MSPPEQGFAARVVAWQSTHGRNSLPWQNTRDPYRVWLSEIMLQQTQVATVLDYFPRFLARLPDVRALAEAPADVVLGLWSGLGYYSRARNLHRCAQQVVERFGGEFPHSAALLETLPGIGRSTAGAIASFCFGERVAILDANVKRVLTRALGFAGDLARPVHERELWDEATRLLPEGSPQSLHASMPRYTQGLMDLGATVCLSRKPTCLLCPVQQGCVAQAQGRQEDYPVRTRKLRRSSESWWLLLARQPDGRVWLERRPAKGIWAGLHCLPVHGQRQDLEDTLPPMAQDRAQELPVFLHVLTHKDLHLHPVLVPLPLGAQPSGDGRWASPQEWEALGLPAPVRKLLQQFV